MEADLIFGHHRFEPPGSGNLGEAVLRHLVATPATNQEQCDLEMQFSGGLR